jgi:histidine triad (HIT) family protein
VIPRRHVQHFLLLDPPLGAALMAAVVHVGRSLDEVLMPEGMNLISSAGAAATQTVPHLHFHVVPRWSHDKIGDIWPPQAPMDERLEEDLADRVRAVMRD